MRECKYCGKPLTAYKSRVYCDAECRRLEYNRRNRARYRENAAEVIARQQAYKRALKDARPPRPCKLCGELIPGGEHALKLYCSRRCYKDVQNAATRRKYRENAAFRAQRIREQRRWYRRHRDRELRKGRLAYRLRRDMLRRRKEWLMRERRAKKMRPHPGRGQKWGRW